MRKEKNGNREAALAHTTIYVNVDKVGQTPHKRMKIGHLSEGASLFSYYFQGVSCEPFLGRTHAPRTSRFRCARTRVRTSDLRWSHFAPAPALLVD